jgi:biotin-dependent carboxylase-like uncharacterized protein
MAMAPMHRRFVMIEVLDGGVQTTVQDGGRPGYLASGYPPAGAQDYYALSIANLLVGNELTPPPMSSAPPGHAGLEMLIKGASLRFEADALFALAGANMAATLDGEPVPCFRPVRAMPGSLLRLGFVKSGARGYFAIAGGIDVPLCLKSRSTFIRARRGGLEGRPLRAGDRVRVGEPTAPLQTLAQRRLPRDLPPALPEPRSIRVVLGPQDYMFTADSIETFLAYDWELSPVSDRMGMRLIGPPLVLRERPDYLVRDAGSGAADIVDDVIPIGGIQVPGGIEPIVMGVENPTAGGYAKIATVISTDLSKMGQIMPRQTLRFVAISQGKAIAIRERQWRALKESSTALRTDNLAARPA